MKWEHSNYTVYRLYVGGSSAFTSPGPKSWKYYIWYLQHWLENLSKQQRVCQGLEMSIFVGYVNMVKINYRSHPVQVAAREPNKGKLEFY